MTTYGATRDYFEPGAIRVLERPDARYAAEMGPWAVVCGGRTMAAFPTEDDAHAHVLREADLVISMADSHAGNGCVDLRAMATADGPVEMWAVVDGDGRTLSFHDSRREADDHAEALVQAGADWRSHRGLPPSPHARDIGPSPVHALVAAASGTDVAEWEPCDGPRPGSVSMHAWFVRRIDSLPGRKDVRPDVYAVVSGGDDDDVTVELIPAAPGEDDAHAVALGVLAGRDAGVEPDIACGVVHQGPVAGPAPRP